MHLRIFAVTIVVTLFLVPVHAQQSHWASADDETAKNIIEMEHKSPQQCQSAMSYRECSSQGASTSTVSPGREGESCYK